MPSFENVFIIEPLKHKDTTPILKYTEKIVYLLNGDVTIETALEKMREKLLEFDPDTDAIIPVGRAANIMQVGLILGSLGLQGPVQVAVWKDGDYTFMPVRL